MKKGILTAAAGLTAMRRFEKASGSVVPKEFRMIEFKGTKAGDYRAKWFALSDPAAMENDFTIPCATFYPGDYENVPFQTVVTPERLKRHVRTSGKDLALTFRVNVVGQEGAKVKVEDLETCPIMKR